MGAVPKRRISTGRKGRRRSGHKVNLPTLIPCPACGLPKKPHFVCPFCGEYKKNKVIETEKKKKTSSGKNENR